MDNMLTAVEISEFLKISYEKALGFIKYSGIDYIRVGRQYRVCEKKFWEFIGQKGRISVEISESYY